MNFKKTNFYCFLLLFRAILIFFMFYPAITEAAEIVKVNLTEKDGTVVAEFLVRDHLVGRLPQSIDQNVFKSRVEKWKNRLQEIITKNPPPFSISVNLIRGQGVVFRGDTQLFYFDDATAKMMNTTPLKMAQEWAANIRFVLQNTPTFILKNSSIAIPLNEEAEIFYDGKFFGNLEFLNYDPSYIHVSAVSKLKKIIFKGLKLGKGSLVARAGDIERIIYFRVQERAAKIPRHMTLNVSGNPAPSKMIEEAFKSVINYVSEPKVGSKLIIGNILNKGKFTNIPPHEKRQLIIPVKAEGSNYIPSLENVHMTVENVGFERHEPKLLFVSNKPEIIKQDGTLFQGIVREGEPVRYFYHHKNAHHQAFRHFVIMLENPTSSPVKVFISPVGAGPTRDEIFAGHIAASDYFNYRKNRFGWFLNIKPGTSYLLEKRVAKTDQTISGMGYINIVEGSMLNFSCSAFTIPGMLAPENTEPYMEKPEARTSKGTFPAFVKIFPVHEIGGKYTYIYIGGEPYQTDVNYGHPNWGNYGVLYDIDLTVKNNRESEKDARIYFVPGGGAARAVFEVDGKIIETSLQAQSQQLLLKKISVPVGETRNVRIKTIPQGGSFYPVKIVVESEFVKK